MDNPEKLATYGTQDEEKQNKNTAQYVLDTLHTQIMQTRHEPPTNNWRQIRTEHRFHEEVVTDITT